MVLMESRKGEGEEVVGGKRPEEGRREISRNRSFVETHKSCPKEEFHLGR